ncbi:hypothetical protein [Streptomyces sp. NPDC015131]|uniref:hypothetical protein n=1 Tax=Streptomyces sp. NPDC015131 TaxID=3364941 RepID=UPI003701419F
MPNEHHVRTLSLSDGPARRAKPAADPAAALSLADEELLERYPAVRGVAERWLVLREESAPSR